MRFDTPETARVAALLGDAGFHLRSYEPPDESEDSPDLWVSGPRDFWAEVKSINPERYLNAFDLAREYGGGDLVNAVRNVSARTLLIAFSSDWLYPPSGSEELAAALHAAGKDVALHVIVRIVAILCRPDEVAVGSGGEQPLGVLEVVV